VTITEIFEWLHLAIGLLVVAGIFATASFAGYFTIHELKEKDVKKIQNRRLADVRHHLSKLAKECSESKKITEDIENKFQALFESEYAEAHEPIRILRIVDFSFLFSGILFLGTALLDWADSNSVSLSLQSLPFSLMEAEMFFFGIFLLASGFFNVERLRRMTAKEELDPAPFNVILILGGILAIDVALLWMTGSIYDSLTFFGKALFFSSLLPFIGTIVAITTWEEEDWKRILGMVLLFAPYFLIFGRLILSALHIL
jgi:hypothetical protein